MNGEAAVARDHHHALAHRLVVERARLRRDGDLGGRHVGAHGCRQPVLDGGDAVERQRAAHRDGEIDETARGRPGAPAPARRRTTPGTRRAIAVTRFAHAGRRRIRQGVDGAAPEPPAGNADEHRDHDRCGGIGPGIAERDTAQPGQDRDRGPHVGAEMERIGFQRLARRCARDPAQRARAEKVDHDRAGDDGEGGDRRLDSVLLRADQPLHRFPDHHRGEQEQQRRLGQRGDALDLAVAVLMLGVGRLAGMRTAK